MGPGLVSTSPATISNRDTAKNKDKRGVALALKLRLPAHVQLLPRPASLPKAETASFPPSHTPVTTFSANESSRKRHNWGASEITRPRFIGTRRREPLWAWYHLNFLFSQLPIRARHSSTPLGGIFESRRWSELHSWSLKFSSSVRQWLKIRAHAHDDSPTLKETSSACLRASLCLYHVWVEERLFSPEVPGAGGLRTPDVVLDGGGRGFRGYARLYRMPWQGPGMSCSAQRSIHSRDRGEGFIKVTPEQDTPVSDGQHTTSVQEACVCEWLCQCSPKSSHLDYTQQKNWSYTMLQMVPPRTITI